jgi:putative ABC transport system ATP-binding protein
MQATGMRPHPDDAGPTFEIRDLAKVYRTDAGEVHALRGVDLDLAAGELVVMLGPSGSGKSTLLNILGGLDVPTGGRVLYRGRNLGGLGERARTRYRRDEVGFVFQFYNLIASLTARENVALATEIAAAPMTPDEALALVGLSRRRGHFPAELSGGEQQRVAVARAIAKRPSILLCDEPTGALDSATGIQVLEALQQAADAIGATTVLITHNASIAGLGDRVISFADGRIAATQVNPARQSAQSLSW